MHGSSSVYNEISINNHDYVLPTVMFVIGGATLIQTSVLDNDRDAGWRQRYNVDIGSADHMSGRAHGGSGGHMAAVGGHGLNPSHPCLRVLNDDLCAKSDIDSNTEHKRTAADQYRLE